MKAHGISSFEGKQQLTLFLSSLSFYARARRSTATLTIVVQRIPFFYNFNFILVLVLLVLVSFFSFLVPANSLDSRLSLTLTVVLGLNVFQIVVIDNVPAVSCEKGGGGKVGL